MNLRKILLAAAVVLFAAGLIQSAVGRNSEPKADNTQAETSAAPEAAATENPASGTVTITASGDCTFATDINASPEGSFVSTVEANNYDYSYFLKNVAPVFAEDDLTIVNFEGTLSNQGERADKTFAFRGSPDYVNILTSSSVEAANLANNHSSDYGDVSRTDTQTYLDQAGILNFRDEIPAMTNINGVTVGLAGVNALNETEVQTMDGVISSLKSQGAQLVILSVHWGIEKDTAPSEEQIALAHKAIDLGADLVIGTHPHVLQGIEKYKGRYIAYSLGNFCFGGNNDPSDKDTVLYRQTFTFDNGVLRDDDNVEIIPCRISSTDSYNDYQPKIAEGEQKAAIEEKMNEYTAALGNLQLKYR